MDNSQGCFTLFLERYLGYGLDFYRIRWLEPAPGHFTIQTIPPYVLITPYLVTEQSFPGIVGILQV